MDRQAWCTPYSSAATSQYQLITEQFSLLLTRNIGLQTDVDGLVEEVSVASEASPSSPISPLQQGSSPHALAPEQTGKPPAAPVALHHFRLHCLLHWCTGLTLLTLVCQAHWVNTCGYSKQQGVGSLCTQYITSFSTQVT